MSGTDTVAKHTTAGQENGDGHARREAPLVLYRQDGPVARITLNRPDKRNALSFELIDELVSALDRVRRAESVNVLVLDGAGGTFSTGVDITQMVAWGNPDQAMRRIRRYQDMADAIEGLEQVTIAAVEGFAIGGGVEITLACDFVLATEGTQWGMPEADLGVTPGIGGTARLARLVGRRAAKELLMIGALQTARRAVDLGLWSRVVPDRTLETELQALIEVLLSKNQQALRQLKLIVNRGIDVDLHAALGFEMLSGSLMTAVNGGLEVPDADPYAASADAFAAKGELWLRRRELAKQFWA